MKKIINIQAMVILLIITTVTPGYSTYYIWKGDSSSTFNNPMNWAPSTGYPSANDTIEIKIGTHAPKLDQDRGVVVLIMSEGTLDLDGYTFGVNNAAQFNDGTITAGLLIVRGELCKFHGTSFYCTLDIVTEFIEFSGGAFNAPCYFETYYDGAEGQGGCVFNSDVVIVNSGDKESPVRMAQDIGDIFNGSLTLTVTGNGAIYMSEWDTSLFNGTIFINNTGEAPVVFGENGGVSILASGNSIAIGDSGFTENELFLNHFHQFGSELQELIMDGSSSLIINDCAFEGPFGAKAWNILCGNSIFYNETAIEKFGDHDNHWSGGNEFYGNTVISNLGESTLLLAEFQNNVYYANVYFETDDYLIIVCDEGGESEFQGDITISNDNIHFDGFVTVSGNNSQEFSGDGNFEMVKFILDKPAGDVKLNTGMNINGYVNFISGILYSDSVNLLTFLPGTEALNAHNGSFVSGPVKKVGDTSFQFPIGQMGAYLPITISAPLQNTDAYTAQMFFSRQLLGNDKEVTVDYLSEYNYWKLERNNGSSKVKIGLNWDNRLNPVIDTSRLKIAFWDDDEWKDLGHGEIVGNYSQGKMISVDSVSLSGYFLFAYSENTNGSTNRGIGIIRNDGQVINSDSVSAENIHYYAIDGSTRYFFGTDTISQVYSITHALSEELDDSLYRVDMILMNGAGTSMAYDVEPNNSYLNFLLGYLSEPVTEVPHFNKIIYESAFENIDLEISKSNSVQFKFMIQPGGTVDSIKIRFDGATEIAESDNRLFISTPLGTREFSPVEAWYDSAGFKISVDAGYRKIGIDTLSFEIGAYDPEISINILFGPALPLPPHNDFGKMYWSTFVETDVDITDSYYKTDDNTIYTIGNTNAQVLLPGTATINPLPNNNSQDALIIKFKANRDVEWWTYYGGGGSESEGRIWVNPSGKVVIAGETGSPDLPITNLCSCPTSCYCQSFNGIPELYFAKLVPDGTFVEYSTWFGGSGAEELHSITGDLSGNIYIGGVNFSSLGFPFKNQSGAFNQTYGGGSNDPFIAKFDNANQLTWCTSFGGDNSVFGSNNEEVTGMCTDASGNLYVTGTTGSHASDPFLTCSPCTTNTDLGNFPVTDIGGVAYEKGNQGSTDAYFIKFDTQNRLVWSTMFGGSDMELFQGFVHNNKGIAVNNTGEIFSIGSTKSDDISDLTPSATSGSYFQDDHKGNYDMYIVKFSPQFELLYATLYGGTGNDVGIGVAIDNNGNIYFTGSTNSTELSTDPFPLQPPNPFSPGGDIVFQDVYGGGSSDAFLIKFQSDLKHLLTTYIGGDGEDIGRFVLSNGAGNSVILGGHTNSANDFNVADPGGLSYFSGTNPGMNGGFVSNLVNTCTGCGQRNISTAVLVATNNLLLFPNPVSDLLQIKPSEETLNGSLRFYDISGRKVSIPTINHGTYFIADVGELSDGVYICVYESMSFRKIEKFIIHH